MFFEKNESNSFHTTWWIHLPLMNLMVKITALIPQSENIPIQTPMGPMPTTLMRKVASVTLQSHMVRVAIIMENFTSPAALKAYAVTKEGDHKRGLNMVIQPSI